MIAVAIGSPDQPQCPAPDQFVQIARVEVQHGAVVQAGGQINQGWPLLRLTQAPRGARVGVHLARLRPSKITMYTAWEQDKPGMPSCSGGCHSMLRMLTELAGGCKMLLL